MASAFWCKRNRNKLADKKTEISLKDLAELCAISERRVQQLAKEGVMIPTVRGFYVYPDSPRNYIKSISSRSNIVRQDKDGEYIDFDLEKARKTRAEADLLERKNQEASGEVISLEEVQKDISVAVGICSKIIGSMKIRIARIAPEMSNRGLELIEREQAKMMDAIIELDESYTERDADQ